MRIADIPKVIMVWLPGVVFASIVMRTGLIVIVMLVKYVIALRVSLKLWGFDAKMMARGKKWEDVFN